ncbi:MAG: type II toxin-antitoxin system RelE/ParE family toxin [Paracoccaceae bacterium]|nr:type II toxin-antitoxin system RelE/ParE family toxin [Paracoccaceae bacterium]
MITGFRHKGLKALYQTGSSKAIRPDLVRRVSIILAILDEAHSLDDLRRPSLRLHALGGTRKGDWSVSVNAQWRITFTCDAGEFGDVDLEDYH